MTLLSGDGYHYGGRSKLDVVQYHGRNVVGWMPQQNRDILQMLIDKFQVKTVIEVGAFLGLSACWFAERVDQVTSIDHFAYKQDHWNSDINRAFGYEVKANQYDIYLESTAGFPNIAHHKMDSLDAAATLDVTADLIYIDAAHEYEDVKADVEAWAPHALKVICGDDNTHRWPSVQQYAGEIGANVDGRVWWKPV